MQPSYLPNRVGSARHEVYFPTLQVRVMSTDHCPAMLYGHAQDTLLFVFYFYFYFFTAIGCPSMLLLAANLLL